METAVKIVGVLHIIVALVIITVILLQQAKKPGMSGVLGGNMDNSYYGRNKGRTRDGILAKVTTVCAIIFLCTSLFLAYNFALTDRMDATQETENGSENSLSMEDLEAMGISMEDLMGEGTADDGAAEAGTETPAETGTETPAE